VRSAPLRALAALAVLVSAAIPSGAGVLADERSDNMRLVANVSLPGATDLEFTRDGYVVMTVNGSDAESGLWVIDVRDPLKPKKVGHLPCAGSGYDVGLVGDTAVMSIDSASGNSSTKENGCNLKGTEGQEGIRLVDVSDRAHPREVKFVETPCGSHTNIAFSKGGRDLVYVQSYPASTSGACPSLHGIISVVDITKPAKAKIVAQPSVLPAVGCHDGTIAGDLAYMACLTEGQVWDISDPLAPTILSHIRDVPDAIWHSSAVSNDGDVVAFGFESFQAGGASCNGAASGPTGAIWFYDVSDPASPVQQGFYSPPRLATGLCTAHNFAVVPGRNVLVSSWYSAGAMAVDFSDPSAPEEIAHYRVESGTSTWDAKYRKGYVFVGDTTRGLDVYKIKGL
jgi:hypothetical protein